MSVLGPVAAKCFNHEGIEIEKTITISKSLIFNRLAYAAGAWRKSPNAENKKFTKAVMHVWRRPPCSTYQHSIDAHQPPCPTTRCWEFNLMAPSKSICSNCCGNNAVVRAMTFAAMGAQRSWLDAVRGVLQWLKTVDSAHDTSGLNGLNSLSSWIPFLIERPVW